VSDGLIGIDVDSKNSGGGGKRFGCEVCDILNDPVRLRDIRLPLFASPALLSELSSASNTTVAFDIAERALSSELQTAQGLVILKRRKRR
jgi:hypothetical protein